MSPDVGQPSACWPRVGVIPTIAPCLVPSLLPRLDKAWPDLKLFLREETSQAACDSLHRGQVDCVLLALPYSCGDVETAELFEDRLFVVFPPGMWDDAPDTVTPGGIDESRLLLLEAVPSPKDHPLAACNTPELPPHATQLGT